MFKINEKAKEIFNSEIGAVIYDRINQTIRKYKMDALIESGVLLGFSGGADSVMLLLFLLEYRRRNEKDFNLLCVHVNHGIRGDEAKRDEEFSREIVSTSLADFESVSVDVPALALESGTGLEETARNARYSVFHGIIESRNDILCIAVAHNATDNAETIIFNMLRGTGLSGVCGIKPTRDNIIRPLLGISKREIVGLLENFNVPYVIDSTNLSSEYSRNYIRNEILPLFERLSANPESSITRMSENLLEDLKFIDKSADEFIKRHVNDANIDVAELLTLPDSLFARVISKMIYRKNGIYPEEKHISAIKRAMSKKNFNISLSGKYNFSCQRGKCFFVDKSAENPLVNMIFPLSSGENIINGTNIVVYLGDIDKSFLNVYNFSIQANVSSDIIDNGVYLRIRAEGDSYRYKGMTHKLKKVFNDRNIPPVERDYIPIIADNDGILWIPGLPVRDEASSGTKKTSITVCYKETTNNDVQMFTALKRM